MPISIDSTFSNLEQLFVASYWDPALDLVLVLVLVLIWIVALFVEQGVLVILF